MSEVHPGRRKLRNAGTVSQIADAQTSELVSELVHVMERIAAGRYDNEVHAFTTDNHPEIVRRIAEAMGMMMVKVEAREHRLMLYAEQLKRANEELKRAMTTTVIGMVRALGARDPYTEGHDQRTAGYAMRLARRIGLGREEAETVYIGAMLHDIGKIGFSDRLFSGEDCKAAPELFEAIKEHPGIGSSILSWLDYLGEARDVVRHHHERMDGAGYPDGLSGASIPLGARIVAVADTFDAMTTDRPYKKGKDMEQGLDILRAIAGSHLDSELVAAFCEEVRENGME